MQVWMSWFFCARGAWALPLRWLLWATLALCCGLAVRAAAGTGTGTATPALAASTATDWATPAAVLPLTPQVRYVKEAPNQPLDWQQALASAHW